LSPNQDQRPQTPNPKQTFIRNITSAASIRSQKISQKKTADLQAMVDEVDGIMENTKSKSYLTDLYADDQFLLHRIEFEEQIVQDAKD
jgi:hypothetical protein